MVVGGRVQLRSDGSREVVADRLTPVAEVLRAWVDEIFLSLDLEAAGQAGLAQLESIFTEFGADPLLNTSSPEPSPEETPLSLPVPLVIQTERDGQTWLLKSGDRAINFTLACLRRLRVIQGAAGLRLRVLLPAPIQRKRFNGRG